MADDLTDQEIVEARQFVNRFGPSNSWTGTAGTAARLIGRLLQERERLLVQAARRETTTAYWQSPHD